MHEPHFVNPGIKIDGCYYRGRHTDAADAALHCSMAGDAYVFQQDSAPAHRAHQTVELLQRETLRFIAPDLWPPNSPDLNPIDC